jgi:hypothetical protein
MSDLLWEITGVWVDEAVTHTYLGQDFKEFKAFLKTADGKNEINKNLFIALNGITNTETKTEYGEGAETLFLKPGTIILKRSFEVFELSEPIGEGRSLEIFADEVEIGIKPSMALPAS